MDDSAVLLERFERDRAHLRAVAYRMLGSLAEAEDAVQDAWLRASRADIGEVRNLGGWLTTVVARVCLNMLRSRAHRREEPLDADAPEPAGGSDPAQEAELADAVGVAMLVVLDTLAPDERLAFVLHDMFAVPFDRIAPMIEKTPAAARQLASRARRRVKGSGRTDAVPAAGDPGRRRRVVDAYLAATRGGDFEALVALLHPEVVFHADAAATPTPEPVVLRGAKTVAKGAMTAAARARFTGLALLDGRIGLVMAPRGRVRVVLLFEIGEDGITAIDAVADPERLERIEIAVPDA